MIALSKKFLVLGCMTFPLPTSVNFCDHEQENWLRVEIMENKMNNLNFEEDSISYTLDISIEYDPELMPLLINYPPMPCKRVTDESMISQHTHDLLKSNNQKLDKNPRLISDLSPKRVIVHSAFLKSLLTQGVIVTDLHKAAYCTQSPWIRDYVELNNQRRSLAKDDFLKSFYKLKVRQLSDDG